MSKVPKKKRVARVNSDVVRDGISNGCFDYVTSILKNMDHSFSTTVQSNITKISDGKECFPSTSKECSQNTSKICPKRFRLSQKFPLMEKTQRTLKHIKHNRSIPKQRAHLATFSDPPIKKNVSRNNSKGSTQIKSKNRQSLENTKNRSVSQGENSAGMTIKNKNIPQKKSANFSTFCESDENSQQATTVSCSKLSKVSSKKSINDFDVEKRYNYRGTCSENDNLNNMTIVDDSNGDTTDDEYEKFIQKNKKVLKSKQKTKNSMKKARKNTVLRKISKLSDSDSSDDTLYHKPNSLKIDKNCKMETKARKKTVLRKISKLSDSDCSDVALYHKTHKTNKLKVSKDCQIETKVRESDSDLELDSDQVNCETGTRDTSESDVGEFEEQLQGLTDSEFVEQNKNCLTAESQLLSVKNNLPDTCSEFISNDDALVSTESFEQNNSSDISLIFDTAASGNDCENMSRDFSIFDTAASGKDCENMSRDFNILTSSKKEDNHEINIAQSDDEESDIEIIDIVIAPKKKVGIMSAGNSQCVINDSMNKNLNEATSQSSVEKKKLQNCQIEDDKHKKENNDEKHEAVYITDICKKEIDSKVNILKQPTSNKNFNVSEVSVSHNKNKLICEVKKEDSDDDIIFECVVPPRNMNEKCASAASVHGERTQIKTETPNSFISNKIPSVKTENGFNNLNCMSKVDLSSFSNSETLGKNENVSLKELKLYEVACSNLGHTANLSGNMLDKLRNPEEPVKENKDIKHLVELFKKEFQVYREIVQTEASVEASLKVIETRQAEKLQIIRSLISNSMGEKCDNSNINEQINLLCKTQKMSNAEASSTVISEDLKDVFLQKTTGITSLSQDECPIRSQKIVLPSVVDKDVKPNLSLLDNIPMVSAVAYQHSILRVKSEAISTVHDSSNTSDREACRLVEKCNLCGKEANLACQRCAKVFFCSEECGKKFWNDGHGNECGK